MIRNSMTATSHHTDDWRDEAARADMPVEWWFPTRGQAAKQAIAICNTCPVKAECLDFALTSGERFGIYGGVSERQRKRMRLGMPIDRRLRATQHGTSAGYHWHLVHHEAACWACVDAESRYRETMSELRKDGLS